MNDPRRDTSTLQIQNIRIAEVKKNIRSVSLFQVIKLLEFAGLVGSLSRGITSAIKWNATNIYWADPKAVANVLSTNTVAPRLRYTTAREALTCFATTFSNRYFESLPNAKKSSISLNFRVFTNANANHSEAHLFLALFGEYMEGLDAMPTKWKRLVCWRRATSSTSSNASSWGNRQISGRTKKLQTAPGQVT